MRVATEENFPRTMLLFGGDIIREEKTPLILTFSNTFPSSIAAIYCLPD